MRGATLPGGRTVGFVDVPDPRPGPGQVVVGVRASGLCGSDLRTIYRRGPGESTPYVHGTIAGHEPAGEVLALGAGVHSVRPGDRVSVYHIAGCGQCRECRIGSQVSCESSLRSAYGYHRNGGHAPYLLAEERSLIRIPEQLSYVDGALASCGLGTAYQGVVRADVSARDRVLVVGLGPLGLGVALLAAAMGAEVVAAEVNEFRREFAARILGISVTEEPTGAFEVTVDCSGSAAGRSLALHAARRRARVVFLGEGGEVTFEPSPQLIRQELHLFGSWVCGIGMIDELFEFMVRTGTSSEPLVTERFPRDEADSAYRSFDAGNTGKVILE